MRPCETSSTGGATRVTGKVRILEPYCKGCGLCVRVCEFGVLRMADTVNERGIRVAVVCEGAECKCCARCYMMCPDAAIVIEKGKG